MRSPAALGDQLDNSGKQARMYLEARIPTGLGY
jgi:hypothetical protein